MNKAFVKESDNEDDEEALALAQAIPAGAKNYITPAGYQRIKDELLQLIDVDRPEVVRIVHWAASNGDRSENGDYIYGKRRLREIDRRIRFLTKRMDSAAVVDPSVHYGNDQVFFGATVTYQHQLLAALCEHFGVSGPHREQVLLPRLRQFLPEVGVHTEFATFTFAAPAAAGLALHEAFAHMPLRLPPTG
jgi:hypothetical protein